MTPAEYNKCLPMPGIYARDWRAARKALSSGITVRLGRAFDYRTFRTLEEFDREFRGALERRIDARAGIKPRGRRDNADWFTGCRRDARAINDYFGRRIMLRLCNLSTLELRKRYAGRIPRDYSEE